MDKAKALLEHIAKTIVDNPDSIIVEGRIDELGVLLTLTAHKKDMGQIIGKEGVTAKALRHFVRLVGIKERQKINLKIVDPE